MTLPGFLTRPSPTHWSNAFSFRRRETVLAGAAGKPSLVIGPDMLEMIGADAGDDMIVRIADDGTILVRKAQNV